MPMQPFANKDVAARYDALPEDLRGRVLALRQMIYQVAAATKGVGTIEECLKWGVPSYLTVKPKSGTTIRLDGNPARAQYGLYVHCQTTLIATFREIYPDTFTYEKNRAIIFGLDEEIAEEELRHCISMALTYHQKR